MLLPSCLRQSSAKAMSMADISWRQYFFVIRVMHSMQVMQVIQVVQVLQVIKEIQVMKVRETAKHGIF